MEKSTKNFIEECQRILIEAFIKNPDESRDWMWMIPIVYQKYQEVAVFIAKSNFGVDSTIVQDDPDKIKDLSEKIFLLHEEEQLRWSKERGRRRLSISREYIISDHKDNVVPSSSHRTSIPSSVKNGSILESKAKEKCSANDISKAINKKRNLGEMQIQREGANEKDKEIEKEIINPFLADRKRFKYSKGGEFQRGIDFFTQKNLNSNNKNNSSIPCLSSSHKEGSNENTNAAINANPFLYPKTNKTNSSNSQAPFSILEQPPCVNSRRPFLFINPNEK